MDRIGLFGGTFNPPHIGHLRIASAVRDKLSLDRIIFIPAKVPPHKQMPAGSPSARHRLAMVSLAVRDLEKAEVSDLEIQRNGPSYTATTIEVIAARFPDAVLWLIVGTDMLMTISGWYRPDIIFKHCRIAAAGRETGEMNAIQIQADRLKKDFGACVDVVQSDVLPISSTELRSLLPGPEAEKWLPSGVYSYIKEMELYQKHDFGA